MSPSLILSLLLLSLLLSDVQGIRLDKGFNSAGIVGQNRIQKEETGSAKRNTNGGGIGEHIVCKDGECSGNNRKLISVTPSTTTTTSSKAEKNGTNKAEPTSNEEKGNRQRVEEENFTVKSSEASSNYEHLEGPYEQYPEIVDIAEMDYSPARRKPPIHN